MCKRDGFACSTSICIELLLAAGYCHDDSTRIFRAFGHSAADGTGCYGAVLRSRCVLLFYIAWYAHVVYAH